ncbi:hypothetical protein D3C72_2564790 [compost metagenome]
MKISASLGINKKLGNAAGRGIRTEPKGADPVRLHFNHSLDIRVTVFSIRTDCDNIALFD